MSGLRILWWCNGLDPPVGGAEIWARRIAGHLAGLGHDSRIFAVSARGTAASADRVDGMPFTQVALGSGPADRDGLARAIAVARDTIADHRPDLLIVNELDPRAMTLLGLVRSALRCPHVVIAHSAWPDLATRRGAPADLAIRSSTGLLCFGSEVAHWLEEHWPDRAPVTIPLMVPPFAAPPAAVPGQRTILYCGRLSPEKGVTTLVEAFGRLAGAFPDATLTIAGTGAQESEVRQRIAALGIGDRVRCPGQVPHAAVAGLIDAAGLVCVPSIREAVGMIALEAALRGRAVVASDVGGLPGIVAAGETGLLCPPGDPVALGDALAVLLADPALACRMGAAALRRAARWPSWESHRDRVTAWILDAASTAGRDAHPALD